MPKITEVSRDKLTTIKAKTSSKKVIMAARKWWLEKSKADRASALLDTAAFLKENQSYRYRQASTYARLYGNMPLMGNAGVSFAKFGAGPGLPLDRPTMNVIQSCVDTLVSRITQSRPRPVFLTDDGDYRQRRLAKQLNQFAVGELYQTDAYKIAEEILRDGLVLGTGCVKIYKDQDDKGGQRVCLERVLLTELLVDPNDSLYGKPRCFYQLKLVDRAVLADMFPKDVAKVEKAEQAYPEQAEQTTTLSDQVMLVEGWHLKSGPNSDDGMHIIACVGGGNLFEEGYNKDDFPFEFLPFSQRLLGFWGQSLAEQLMGTQVEINKLLVTISRSINLVGVPRVFVEDGSKVVKAHLNNEVGSIITFRGTKPEYVVAPCVPQEVYAQLQRLIDYAYQQSGISALAASSKKPEGLNSGVALREFDDLQSDRFATLSKRYDNFFINCLYKMIDQAKDIAEETGKYQTVYPGKNGTKEIDLPKADLLKDTFVIQCFDASSLPRDPAGRLEKITEMIQSGMISIQEGRRMLDYPDLEQQEKLANSGEERILQILDEIVEDGKYTPPDPFMDLGLALKLSVQYYNLYVPAKLEEKRAELLRTFNTQVQALQQASIPQPQPQAAGGGPLAVPQPLPESSLLPMAPSQAA